MREISEELLKRAGKGDMEAFHMIYKETSSYVYTIALRVANNTEDAQEITQDVFMSAYRNLRNFRFRASFRTWLYRVTVNTAINLVNKRKRRSGRTVSRDQHTHLDSAAHTMPDAADKSDNDELLKGMLEALPPEQRACIVLKEIEGLKYREIAETLRININTVRSRLLRARQRLVSQCKKGRIAG